MGSAKKYTTVLSFCTGLRGIERGIETIIPNLRTICSVEREAFIIENLVAEMESGLLDPHPIWPDVTNFPAEHFRGMVDIFTGGYPCPGESVAGKRLGEEDPRWLWNHFEMAIGIIHPRICFFENVRGHITKGLPTVIESLEGLGYKVHWGIFSAEETGASHKRERVFIMAVRRDVLDNSSGNGLEPNDSISAGRNSAELAGSPELADMLSEGLEGHTWNEQREGWQRVRQDRPITESSIPQSVARPGQPQHEWECLRVTTGQWETKSGMGGAVNGYKFREDFLRALGNSVYPPTAALAWKTLSEEHGL